MVTNPARSPQVLGDTGALNAADDSTGGAIWRLQETDRDLDANVIALPADGVIATHRGPDLDVLIHVLAGRGELRSESETLDLFPGALVWLPKRSERAFHAGAEGLRYLTVHQKRQSLVIDTSRLTRPSES